MESQYLCIIIAHYQAGTACLLPMPPAQLVTSPRPRSDACQTGLVIHDSLVDRRLNHTPVRPQRCFFFNSGSWLEQRQKPKVIEDARSCRVKCCRRPQMHAPPQCVR